MTEEVSKHGHNDNIRSEGLLIRTSRPTESVRHMAHDMRRVLRAYKYLTALAKSKKSTHEPCAEPDTIDK